MIKFASDMPSTRYITVILPLKLEWEPVYATDDPSVDVGSRVSLRFGAGTYVGVVSSVRADALIDPSKVRPILAVETGRSRSGGPFPIITSAPSAKCTRRPIRP